MEIDFLGLNSTVKMEKHNSKDAIFSTETGGVETSLSLSTTNKPSHMEILSESQKKKKKWAELYSSSGSSSTSSICSLTEQPPPVFCSSATAAGFLYKLDDKLTELRKISEIHVEPAMLYSAGSANVLTNKPLTLSDNGCTPTVAMARRATLARFLEKRLHRLNQARTAHLTGKLMNVNKRNNILKR